MPLESPKLAAERVTELKRICNVLLASVSSLDRVAVGDGNWRGEGRAAFAHVSLAVYDFARWLTEQEILEQRDLAQARDFHATVTSTKYLVYHYDTFEEPGEGTSLLAEFDTIEEARKWVQKQFGPNTIGQHLRFDGADRVEIVHRGYIVERFNVG